MTTRLNALETAYLRAEAPGAPLHVASLALFEGGQFFDQRHRFRLHDIREHIAERVHLLPRLRQRIAEVPFDVGRPVWVDDVEFDVANHVEVAHLHGARDDAALVDYVTTRYLEVLDRSRPLWHLLFVTGLADGRVALLERAHHALMDGIGGVDVATVLLDVERIPDPASAEAPPWQPRPVPSGTALLRDALVDRAAEPLRTVAALLGGMRHPVRAVEAVNDVVSSLRATRRDGATAPKSSLNAPVGPHRRLIFVRERLSTLKDAGASYGATVNDVVLAGVTGAVRHLLLHRGEYVSADACVKALVPVSVRATSEHQALGNRVAGLLVPLPVGLGDPTARLRTIAETTRQLKAAHEATSSELLLRAADMLPAPILRPARVAVEHQPLVNLVVTNIPGPPVPLYAMGARMLEAFPIVPLAGNLTLGVAVLSYNGALTIGITCDPDACPDIDAFVAGLHRSFMALGVEWAPAMEPVSA